MAQIRVCLNLTNKPSPNGTATFLLNGYYSMVIEKFSRLVKRGEKKPGVEEKAALGVSMIRLLLEELNEKIDLIAADVNWPNDFKPVFEEAVEKIFKVEIQYI